MTQAAKKAEHHTSSKDSKPSLHPTEMVQKVQDKMRNNMGAFTESSEAVGSIFRDIGSELMESSKNNVSDFVELSQEVFACRTMQDMIGLQNKAMQQLCNSYFKYNEMLHNALSQSCDEVLTSINKNTAVASDKIRKSAAA